MEELAMNKEQKSDRIFKRPPLGKGTGKYTKKSERWNKSATDEEILKEYRQNGGWVGYTARKFGIDHHRVQRLAREQGL